MPDNYLDKSNHVKGLLLLIGKDNKITDDERDFLQRTGSILSFDKKFIENAINELFENEFLGNEPPVFSQKQYAEAFPCDAIQLALVDNDLSSQEIDWLYAIAVSNNLSNEWLKNELAYYSSDNYSQELPELKIEKILKSE